MIIYLSDRPKNSLVTTEEIEAWKASEGTQLNKYDAMRLMDTVLSLKAEVKELLGYKAHHKTCLELAEEVNREIDLERRTNSALRAEVERWKSEGIKCEEELRQQLADQRAEIERENNQLRERVDAQAQDLEKISLIADKAIEARDAAIAANKAEFEAHKLTISDHQKEIRKFMDVAKTNANEREAAYEQLRIVIKAMQGLLDEIALCRFTKQCEPLMIAVVDAEKARAQAAMVTADPLTFERLVK